MSRKKRTKLNIREMTKDVSTAIGYIRVSTDEQGLSVEAQDEKIKAYCLAKDIKLEDCFIDNGVSGSTNPIQRPGFSQVWESINSIDGLDAIVVVKNDRLARNATYQKNIIYTIVDKLNKKYISIENDIDTSKPSGKLFLSLLAEFAEYELEEIRDRTKTALKYLKLTGQAYNREVFGYKKEGSKKNGDKTSYFIKDETEQQIITDIIDYYDFGLSWQKVVDKIQEKYEKKMHRNTARRIYLRIKKERLTDNTA